MQPQDSPRWIFREPQLREPGGAKGPRCRHPPPRHIHILMMNMMPNFQAPGCGMKSCRTRTLAPASMAALRAVSFAFGAGFLQAGLLCLPVGRSKSSCSSMVPFPSLPFLPCLATRRNAGRPRRQERMKRNRPQNVAKCVILRQIKGLSSFVGRCPAGPVSNELARQSSFVGEACISARLMAEPQDMIRTSRTATASSSLDMDVLVGRNYPPRRRLPALWASQGALLGCSSPHVSGQSLFSLLF